MPGHPDELERALRAALATDERVYIRMSEEANAAAIDGDGLTVLRQGSDAAPVVVAVGPTLDPTLAATRDLDATVAYLATVRPFDAEGLRAIVRGHRRRRSSSRIWQARRRRRSARRSPTARTGCWRSASRTSSCAATAPAPSTAPPTASTPRASAARCRDRPPAPRSRARGRASCSP